VKQNIGNADRFIRLVLAVGLLSVVALVQSDVRWWGLLGLIPLLTAFAGNCPLYGLFGLSTCPVARPKR
jgi:hypothetical protein